MLAIMVAFTFMPSAAQAAAKKPARVKTIKIAQSTVGKNTVSVLLRWNKAKNAKKYQVYRLSQKKTWNKYKVVKKAAKNKKKFTKKNLYKVKARKGKYQVYKYAKKWQLAKVVGNKKNYTYKYNTGRKNITQVSKKPIATVSKLKFGKTYRFKVRAVNGKKKSAFSKPLKIRISKDGKEMTEIVGKKQNTVPTNVKIFDANEPKDNLPPCLQSKTKVIDKNTFSYGGKTYKISDFYGELKVVNVRGIPMVVIYDEYMYDLQDAKEGRWDKDQIAGIVDTFDGKSIIRTTLGSRREVPYKIDYKNVKNVDSILKIKKKGAYRFYNPVIKGYQSVDITEVEIEGPDRAGTRGSQMYLDEAKRLGARPGKGEGRFLSDGVGMIKGYIHGDRNQIFKFGYVKRGKETRVGTYRLTSKKDYTVTYDDMKTSLKGGTTYYTEAKSKDVVIKWTCDGTDPTDVTGDLYGKCEYTKRWVAPVPNSDPTPKQQELWDAEYKHPNDVFGEMKGYYYYQETTLRGITKYGTPRYIFPENEENNYPRNFRYEVYKNGKLISELFHGTCGGRNEIVLK